MKLARKLMIALVLGILLVAGGNAFWRETFERRLLDEQIDSVQYATGLTLVAAVEAVFRSDGEEKALRMVSDANDIESRVDIRWIWLDDDPDPDHAPIPEIVPRLGEVRSDRAVTLTRVDPKKNEERRYTYIPLIRNDLRPGALEVSQSLTPKERFLRGSRLILALTTVGMLIMCGLIASTVTFWFVGRPMRLLRDAARRIGAGDLSQRVSLRQGDEIGELAAEINTMCSQLDQANRRAAAETEARIAALEQLRHADRLTTVGRLASGVAHELGTPLNIVSEMAEMVVDGEGDATANARVIVGQTERMTAMIRQLLDFSRRSSIDRAPSDVGDLVRRTTAMLSALAEKSRVSLAIETGGAPLVASVDAGMIQQALTNLIVNAIQASRGTGEVRISLSRCRARPPESLDGQDCEFVVIAVRDRGTGIDAGTLAHVFEPFFTTKPIGEGTGLGLSVAYGIVREHGGWIQADSRPGEGSTFWIFLPAQSADPAAAQTSP